MLFEELYVGRVGNSPLGTTLSPASMAVAPDMGLIVRPARSRKLIQVMFAQSRELNPLKFMHFTRTPCSYWWDSVRHPAGFGVDRSLE
jgi:hypothetical protein